MQYFLMLLSITEILLCNFVCKFKYKSCIVLLFKLKTYICNVLIQTGLTVPLG